MKRLLGTDITGSYIFNPTAKTVTFTGVDYELTLANILLITNVTDNIIIYNFASTVLGESGFENNTLALTYDTTSMSSTDTLQIFLDVESYEESLATLLRRMNKLLESNAVVDNRLRQRITIDAIGNSTAGQTPTEITNTIPVSGTVTASVSGATTLSISANDLQYVQSSQVSPYATKSNTTLLHVVTGLVDERWRIIEDARISYGTAIRPNLIFS